MKIVSHIMLASMVGAGAAMASEKAVDFSQHDRNGDGYLSQGEWRDARMANIGFNELDRNGDQRIDKRELLSRRSAEDSTKRGAGSGGMQEDGDQAGFRQADSNGDGRVSQSEARAAGYDSVAVFYDPIDADGNGYVDEREWELNETAADNDDGANDAGNGTFARYDSNRDGYLDEREAAEEDYVESNFDSWDNNDDGLVDINEAEGDFTKWNADAFDSHDANGDSRLDRNEAADNDFVNANFNEWDYDGDGFLDEDEARETWDGSGH